MADQKQNELQLSEEMGDVAASNGGASLVEEHSVQPAQVLNATAKVEHDYAYYKEVFRGQRMPFAYLDLDLLAHNMQQIVERAGSKRVRLASKSLRSVAILQRILATNQCFQGIMSYSPREAVYLSEQGFTDLLLGYPVWHEEDIAAIARATAKGAQITLMVDSTAHVAQIAQVAHRYGVRLPLCLDIDMTLVIPGLHFGVWRSPLRTTEQVRPIVEQIKDSPHVWLDGVMGYEAQIAGVGDNMPGQRVKNALVQQLKRRSVRELAARRAEVVALINSYGPLRFVNGGGTGSMLSTRAEAAVTEITVGSGFYSPGLFDNYRDFRYQPAAGYAIEIVRRPHPSIYTCLGGGYIASGAIGLEKLPQPYLPTGTSFIALEGPGEVQTPMRYQGPLQLNLGDPIFLRHAKAGELCERFTRLLLVANGSVVDEVTTYRGDGQCFI